MQLDKIGEQQCDKVGSIRPLLVPRDLRALPRPQVRVKFAPQLRDLFSDPLQLSIRFLVAR